MAGLLDRLHLPDMPIGPRACPKGKTRLELKVEARPLAKVDEKTFKADVWRRDKNRCRC